MTKTEYKRYISGPYWQQRRKDFLILNDRCVGCGLPRWAAVLLYDQDLNVHHVSYTNLGAETDEDLRPLCRRCHEVETFGHSVLQQAHSHECAVCGEVTCNPFEEACQVCIIEGACDARIAHNYKLVPRV